MIHNDERLLIKLIEQYYGTLPALASKVLFSHGAILLKRALIYTTLNKNDFLKGLDILVKCNFAKVTTIKKLKYLEIIIENVINILYYPFYMMIINKRFGVESVSLVKTIMLYGSLSINDMIDRTLYHIVQINSLEIDEDQINYFIESLFEKFKDLNAKNIIVCSKNAKSDLEDYNVELIYKSLKSKFNENNTEQRSISINRKSTWILNYDALNFLIFIQLFPYFQNQPFVNEEASFVFNLLLEMTFEKSFSMKKTMLTYDDIYYRYSSKYKDVNISRLSVTLNMFSHFFAPNFIQIEKIGCSLSFELFLEDIVKIICKEFVKKNYGENSVRIFGALLENTCIFENNLLNSLKIDSKELHRNIFLLDLNRMININFYSEANQSSTFSARNVKKSLSVNLEDVVECILKRCYYAIYTILHRRFIEMNDQKDLISRKVHIENYKKEITEQVENEEEKTNLLNTAHNYMSENDHKRAESLLSYDDKINKIEFNIINYVFILNMWKIVNSQNKQND